MSIYDRFSQREREILKARAERVASEMRGQQQSDAQTALLISVQGETYALPIESITVVHEGIVVEPMPCVPAFVSGIANVRGHILPVINLATLLGINTPPIDGPTSLIVVGNDDMSVALYVEQIGEVAALPLDRIAPIPASFSIDRTHHLQGVLPDGTILLDVEAILNDPGLIVDEQVG
jgi:purine-binding chemotaxis protein CheW